MVKTLKLTLICPTPGLVVTRSANVTLRRGTSWSASAEIEFEGQRVEHEILDQPDERAALMSIAEWLRHRFHASTTCLGSPVTVVCVSAAA